jgi:hypothetical protein
VTYSGALVVGTNLPVKGYDPSNARRYPTTVHAVDDLQEHEPIQALCGTFVLYRYTEDPWPPGLHEDWCPACVRCTEKAWRQG